MDFTFSDTWLLHSILNTENSVKNSEEKGAAIKEIIHFADYSNHAIFNYSEFTNSLQKLLSLGLILKTTDGKHFKTEENFSVWFKTKYSKKIRMSVQKEFTGIDAYLQANYKEAQQTNFNIDLGFTEVDFKKTIEAYYQAA